MNSALLLSSLLLPACSRAQAESTPALAGGQTNVLVVVFDTTRADHMSAFGYKHATTPTIEELTTQGVRFDQFVGNASWTRPGFGALLTGLHPRTLGLYEHRDDALAPKFETLAERLHDHGYLTLGMTSNANINAYYGFDQGYDDYRDTLLTREEMRKMDRKEDEILESATQVTDRVLSIVDAHPEMKTQPWLMHAVYIDPHTPLQPPAEHAALFEASRTPAYDAELHYADAELGRLLEELDKRGLMENTLVVVTADHGEGLRDHKSVPLSNGHGSTLYESLIHLPLVITHPSLPRGVALGALSEQVDLVPTLMDLLGYAAPGVAGHSLVPLIHGEPGGAPFVVSETDWQVNDKTAIRTSEYKLVRNDDVWLYKTKGEHERRKLSDTQTRMLTAVPPVELYKLDTPLEDPTQTNLAQSEPQVVKELMAQLQGWEAEHPAALPLNRVAGDVVVNAKGEVIRDDGKQPEVGMDAAMEAQLRELGYIE